MGASGWPVAICSAYLPLSAVFNFESNEIASAISYYYQNVAIYPQDSDATFISNTMSKSGCTAEQAYAFLLCNDAQTLPTESFLTPSYCNPQPPVNKAAHVLQTLYMYGMPAANFLLMLFLAIPKPVPIP